MATHEFRLPDPGEGLVEAEIVTWRVGVGDEIKVNDIVVEIETAKSLVELPSPYAGTVTALLADEGQMVDVGAAIVAISDGADAPAPGPRPGGAHAPRQARLHATAAGEKVAAVPTVADGEGPARVANLVGYGPRPSEASGARGVPARRRASLPNLLLRLLLRRTPDRLRCRPRPRCPGTPCRPSPRRPPRPPRRACRCSAGGRRSWRSRPCASWRRTVAST